MGTESSQPATDHDDGERLVRLCRLTSEMLERMTPAERDRLLQRHLAEARGPQKNLVVLCAMTSTMLRLRQAASNPQEDHHAG